MASLHLTQLSRLQGLAENSCSEMHSMGFISLLGRQCFPALLLLVLELPRPGGQGTGMAAATGQLPAGHTAKGPILKRPRCQGGRLPAGGRTAWLWAVCQDPAQRVQPHQLCERELHQKLLSWGSHQCAAPDTKPRAAPLSWGQCHGKPGSKSQPELVRPLTLPISLCPGC